MAVCLFGLSVETVADRQMHQFKAATDGRRVIRQGLWKHARHPNYLGEILMWWGVYLVLLSARPGLWWLGIGALINTLLFNFISLPLADRRNRAYRDDFDQYWRQTNALSPWPRLLPRR